MLYMNALNSHPRIPLFPSTCKKVRDLQSLRLLAKAVCGRIGRLRWTFHRNNDGIERVTSLFWKEEKVTGTMIYEGGEGSESRSFVKLGGRKLDHPVWDADGTELELGWKSGEVQPDNGFHDPDETKVGSEFEDPVQQNPLFENDAEGAEGGWAAMVAAADAVFQNKTEFYFGETLCQFHSEGTEEVEQQQQQQQDQSREREVEQSQEREVEEARPQSTFYSTFTPLFPSSRSPTRYDLSSMPQQSLEATSWISPVNSPSSSSLASSVSLTEEANWSSSTIVSLSQHCPISITVQPPTPKDNTSTEEFSPSPSFVEPKSPGLLRVPSCVWWDDEDNEFNS